MVENTEPEPGSDHRYLLGFCLMKRYSRAFLWSFVRVATVHPSMRCLNLTVLVFFLLMSLFPLSEMVMRFLKKVDGISPPRQTIYIVSHSFMSALFLFALSNSNPLLSVSLRFYGEQSKTEREKRDSTVEMLAVHFGVVFLSLLEKDECL